MPPTYYDTISQGYDELYKEEQQDKIQQIKQILAKENLLPKKGETLLDIGCGTGISTRCWQSKNTGIDPSEKLIQIAKTKNKCTYLIGQAETLPFPDKSFDIIISITAIQNFSNPKKALQEIKRVGKRIIITTLKRVKNTHKIETLIQNTFPTAQKKDLEKDTLFYSPSQ